MQKEGKTISQYCFFQQYILRGRRNLTLVSKIMLLQMFKIDWILIIKFDTSNIFFSQI